MAEIIYISGGSLRTTGSWIMAQHSLFPSGCYVVVPLHFRATPMEGLPGEAEKQAGRLEEGQCTKFPGVAKCRSQLWPEYQEWKHGLDKCRLVDSRPD